MFIIRPIETDDLDVLTQLVDGATFGLTSLPKDRQLLASRIADSLRGFAKVTETPSGECFLFVMEDTKTGHVIGTSGVVSKVGGFEPFYAYRIEDSLHHSDMLKVDKRVPALHLVEEHNGPCEIGSLFLAPEYRQKGAGRLLSLARFLFIADQRQHFDPQVIAELRGVIDKTGRSPFWDALGRIFFEIEYSHADYLSVVDKRFIADLMPRHPIYIPLLPIEAQQVIGQVHEHTKPARKLLESEGFTFARMVDIFEAGPIFTCPRDKVRTIRDSVCATVSAVSERPAESPDCLISNGRRDFRACRAAVQVVEDGTVAISPQSAKALRIEIGQPIRYVMERP